MFSKEFKLTKTILFRIILILVLAEFVLRGTGYVHSLIDSNDKGVVVNSNYTVLVLGDSFSYYGGKDSWPNQMAEILNNVSDNSFNVFSDSFPSQTSSEILMRLRTNLERYDPDFVVLMAGFADKGEYLAHRNNFMYLPSFFGELKVVQFIHTIFFLDSSKDDDYFLNESLKYKGNSRDLNFEDKSSIYSYLGWVEYSKGNEKKAEEYYLNAIEINESNSISYLGLSYLKYNQRNYSGADQVIRKIMNIDTANYLFYRDMGMVWKNIIKEEYGAAETIFYRMDNYDSEIVTSIAAAIGRGYFKEGEFRKGEEILLKALEFEEVQESVYIVLCNYYLQTGKNEKAYELFNYLENSDANKLIKVYAELIEEFYKKKDTLNSKKISKRLEFLFKGTYNPITKVNFNRIYDILNSNDINAIFVQYPVLDVNSIELMFDFDEKIVIVDNGPDFHITLEQYGFDYLFVDNTFGFFGHCTSEGNRIVAEDILKNI